jgi:hypothetical protein
VRADAAGIDRVGVDLERLGKIERQRGRGTWISPHTEDDLGRIAAVLTRAAPFARVNAWHAGSAGEVDRVIALGARVLMLPMVETVADASCFAAAVRGRAAIVLLVESAKGLEAAGALAAVDGVDEIHVGLNDLALSLGLRSRWLALAGDRLVEASRAVRAAGRRFGFGGIGAVGDDTLPIPSDLIYAEYARTRATAALVARAFPISADLGVAIARTRARLAEWRAASPDARAAAHAELTTRAIALETW